MSNYVIPGPFKAAQSYGPADGEIFFGRETEATALANFFRNRRLSVLTASSGVGKTSLLNAKVLPLLEMEGWITARTRPEEDPVGALRRALMLNLIPKPSSEADVLDGLRAQMPTGGSATLLDSLTWYSSLEAEKRARFKLFTSPETDSSAVLPMTARALRGTITCEDLIEHLEALAVYGPTLRACPDSKLNDLIVALRGEKSFKSWNKWLDVLESPDGIAGLYESIQREWLPFRPGVRGIFVIIDQFEEMFTRLPISKMNQLASEFRSFAFETSEKKQNTHAVSCNFGISLRKEFIADLMPWLQPFGPLERLTFILGTMDINQARQALARPAAIFEMSFEPGLNNEPDCIDKILELATDDNVEDVTSVSLCEDESKINPRQRRYAPILISLIGAHLWDILLDNHIQRGVITWHQFRNVVPNMNNIFKRFLDHALQRFENNKSISDMTQFDVLEVMDRLVTPAGYRNILLQDQLLQELPVRMDAGLALLDVMDYELRLISRESRRVGRTIEIMHERLIAPVRHLLTEFRRKDIVRASLLPAYDMLCMIPDEPDPTVDTLPAHFRESLVRYLDRLELNSLASRSLLRSLLAAGPEQDRLNDSGDIWDVWARMFRELVNKLELEEPNVGQRSQLLRGAELDAALSDLVAGNVSTVIYSDQQIAFSVLADPRDSAIERIHLLFGGEMNWRLHDEPHPQFSIRAS